MKLLFLLFQLAVLVDEHADDHKQNRQSDQIQPAEAQAGVLQKKCHCVFRLPFLLPSPGKGEGATVLRLYGFRCVGAGVHFILKLLLTLLLIPVVNHCHDDHHHANEDGRQRPEADVQNIVIEHIQLLNHISYLISVRNAIGLRILAIVGANAHALVLQGPFQLEDALLQLLAVVHILLNVLLHNTISLQKIL